jgi:hypothetical protein
MVWTARHLTRGLCGGHCEGSSPTLAASGGTVALDVLGCFGSWTVRVGVAEVPGLCGAEWVTAAAAHHDASRDERHPCGAVLLVLVVVAALRA